MLNRRSALASLSAIATSLAALKPAHAAPKRMPVLFIGHGSPMNAISTNRFTQMLNGWGQRLPAPTAILVVSAHWLSRGATGVTANLMPPTIHDFSGFPRELQEMTYPAPGHPILAQEAARIVRAGKGIATQEWGLDHGTWTVLRHLYPKANVPVFQVSIDYNEPAPFHYAVGRELQTLREKGVLIIGSGNVVHNLRATERGVAEAATSTQNWAQDFDDAVKKALDQRDDKALQAYLGLDRQARMAVPTPDHYWPFLYALGAADAGALPQHVFEGFHSGTLGMRCLQFG